MFTAKRLWVFFNNTVNVTKYFDEKREPMKATNFKIYYCRLKKKNFFFKGIINNEVVDRFKCQSDIFILYADYG